VGVPYLAISSIISFSCPEGMLSPSINTASLISIRYKLFIDPNYYSQNITPKDIEEFTNKWKSLFDKEITVEEWRGEKILDAFNYNGMLDLSKFSSSCANFKQSEAARLGKDSWSEPKKEWYEIYTENPKNISVVVALKEGMVRGRRMMIEGTQVENNDQYIKDKYYRYVNPYYGEGGNGSIYDSKIENYLINKYGEIVNLNLSLYGNLIIQVDNTKFEKYPPFDYFYVNFDKNLLSSGYIPGYTCAYKAVLDGRIGFKK